MAVIRSFRRELKGHATRHPTEVDCLWFDFFDEQGGRVLQLATLGSDNRQSKPKVSQTIQLSADAAQELAGIIRESLGSGAGARTNKSRVVNLPIDEKGVLERALDLIRLRDAGLPSEGDGWTQVLATDDRLILNDVWLVRHLRGAADTFAIQEFRRDFDQSGAERGMLLAPSFTAEATQYGLALDLRLVTEDAVAAAASRQTHL